MRAIFAVIRAWALISVMLMGIHEGAIARNTSFLDCSATLQNDTLLIENSRIQRTWLWNRGDLQSLQIKDVISAASWDFNPIQPDCYLPGTGSPIAAGELEIVPLAESTTEPAHLQVRVITHFPGLDVKRIFRVYPDCPAIACDFFLKGRVDSAWAEPGPMADQIDRQEFLARFEQTPRVPVMERLAPGGTQWQTQTVEFYDRTDVNNNLVISSRTLAFTRWGTARGNLLFADDLLNARSLFMLKQAPCSQAQLAYPGADFLIRSGEFLCIGMGIRPKDLDEEEWLPCYGFVTGVSGADEWSKLQALRTYQDHIRIRKPGRDLMIMMNTWGDRNRDAKLGEAFALKELAAGAELGISHFQLDDGWQSGISKNSAFGQGSWQDNWTRKDYWQVHPDKFPNGLEPVIEQGKKLGIEICLWFNPSSHNSYSNWEADADALIQLYHKYGIRTFKIDGLQAGDKLAEIRFRRMLDSVVAATNGEVVFNLDVTAGKRMGYHYFTRYGNLFLENRYTDWVNYYPHWTLRNLWTLSRYVPPQSLQIEFLNKWRNQMKYAADDPFAPHLVPFDYVFAITMMAQPLAWFEASGLPDEASSIFPVVKRYRELQADLHSCQIFPIGDEPSGRGWTGFQALQGKTGYLLIFRESNQASRQAVKTWLQPGETLRCDALLGQGADFTATVDDAGKIVIELPTPFSYALYRYEIQ